VHLPHETPGPLPASLAERDLVVQRGLRDSVLVALLALESAGTRCCNLIAATRALADRLAVVQRLAAAGIAVPATRPAETWTDIREIAHAGAVVKARNPHAGRDTGVAIVLDGRPPPAPAFPGPWLLQEFVPSDGRVRKLYVVGHHVRSLLKSAGTSERHDPVGVRVRPTQSLSELVTSVGVALGLDIYGVDVIAGPDGPRVIDVNPFPGLRGISDGAALVAGHVRALAR
jgi:ribosomal protein S6--L-glutamate ligase